MTGTGPRVPLALAALQSDLDAVPGTVSVWCGRAAQAPTYARNSRTPHYAASTMKAAVMVAAYRLAEAGRLDLDAEIEVHDEFASATGNGRFRNDPGYDNDPQPWKRLGRVASLRWLIRRMIVKSSNLATNLVLEQVGLPAVAEVLERTGAEHSRITRGIEDYAAAEAGRTNLVSVADLAGLLTCLHAGGLAGPAASTEMLDVLLAQEVVDDVVQGLPEGTRVAHKNGWIEGVRHSAALILPDDAPDFVLVTCITAPLDKQAGCDLVALVARAAWDARHELQA